LQTRDDVIGDLAAQAHAHVALRHASGTEGCRSLAVRRRNGHLGGVRPTARLTGIGHSRANCQWLTDVRVGQAATIPIAVRVGHMRRSKPGNWCGEPRRKNCNLLTAT
jgi:hypothetical protein